MKKIILLLLITTNLSFSQGLSGVENFILASDEDKDLLANNYFNPLFKSMQISMSEGWARSAKTHKKLGFDITFFGWPSLSNYLNYNHASKFFTLYMFHIFNNLYNGVILERLAKSKK